MAKDPAFLFYPGDFNDGTQDFTNEEVGAYIRLLLFQFSQGHLSIDRIKRKLGRDFDSLWPILAGKFILDSEGLFFNQRLESEQFKRKAFSQSRRENILKRYEPEVNNTSTTYVVHMENENRNRNGVKNEVEKEPKTRKPKLVFQPPTFEEVEAFFLEHKNSSAQARKAFDYYSNGNPPWTDSKGNPVRAWKQKMLANWIGKNDFNGTGTKTIDVSKVNFGNRTESAAQHQHRKLEELKQRRDAINIQNNGTVDIPYSEA